jgi:hypothetical protein
MDTRRRGVERRQERGVIAAAYPLSPHGGQWAVASAPPVPMKGAMRRTKEHIH